MNDALVHFRLAQAGSAASLPHLDNCRALGRDDFIVPKNIAVVQCSKSFSRNCETQMSAEQIYQAMMELPQNERFELVARLLAEDTEDEGLVFESAEFADEIELRLNDRAGAVPWEQLRDEELSQ
jgi:hypothetical protein